MSSHKIKATWQKENQFDVNISNHHVLLDGGDIPTGNAGPSPKRMMLAALAACTGVDVVIILDKMRINYSDFSIEVEGIVREEYPKIYEEVFINYSIKLPEADQPKMQKAVELSQEKYCSVSAMFKAFASLKANIQYL